MNSLRGKVNDFLSQKNIAVAGVSRDEKGSAANTIYKKLKDCGYTVYAINPKADEIGGDPCYPDLESTPEKVDGVVIVTRPEVSQKIVGECADLGIKRVWMHRSFGTGSVSDSAREFCLKNNISVIAGACPMMYCQPVDFGHKCMKWVLNIFGKLAE